MGFAASSGIGFPSAGGFPVEKSNKATLRTRRNQRVEVSCPDCAHVQWEAAIAVSTFCRGCGEHFELSKGKAILNGPRNGNRSYLRVSSEDTWNGDTSPASKTPLPGMEKTGPVQQGWLDNSPFSFLKKPSENGSRWSHRGAGPKLQTVACFECGRKHEVSAIASSTMCSSCGSYISLRKVRIRNDSRQKIKTRGDVTIQRKASHGSALACRHLKVLGTVSGSVDCSGDAVFFSECRILGVFSSSSLTIRKKADVHFLRPVYAQNIVVAGKMTGNFYCSGRVTVAGTGSLHGELIARSVTVEPGGVLDASLRVCSQEPAVAAQPRPDTEEEVVLGPEDGDDARMPFPNPALIGAGGTNPAS